LPDLIHSVGPEQPVAIRARISRRRAADLVTLATKLDRLRLSIAACDEFAADIAWLRRGAEHCAEHAVLRYIASRVLPSIRDIIVAAVIAGRRRVTARQLAIACETSRRTIESRLRDNAIAPPSKLVGWAVSLHAAWSLEVVEMSVNNAALASGFASQADFSNYILRHTGQRPSRLKSSGAEFLRLLEEFARNVDGRSTHAGTRAGAYVNNR
jgi:AraC-like DNA-binding protein